MKTPATLSAILIGVLLAACASKPPVPAWQPNAREALDGFTDNYLRGSSGAAQADFARARHATTGTGRADSVAQVELVRCATRTASLEFDDCPGFAALALDATVQQRAYAAYIGGRWEGLDATLLPEQHRAVVAGGSMAAVADPLARLVAAGALFKAGRLQPGDLGAAVETASRQGWRRPLLMWLGLAERRARDQGDTLALERIRRRMALAAGTR